MCAHRQIAPRTADATALASVDLFKRPQYATILAAGKLQSRSSHCLAPVLLSSTCGTTPCIIMPLICQDLTRPRTSSAPASIGALVHLVLLLLLRAPLT